MIQEHGPQINTYIPQGWVAHWDCVKGVEPLVGIGAWSYFGMDTWMTERTI
jgi:hypothetical protein